MKLDWIAKEVRAYGFEDWEQERVERQARAASDILSRKELKKLIEEYANDPSLIRGLK